MLTVREESRGEIQRSVWQPGYFLHCDLVCGWCWMTWRRTELTHRQQQAVVSRLVLLELWTVALKLSTHAKRQKYTGENPFSHLRKEKSSQSKAGIVTDYFEVIHTWYNLPVSATCSKYVFSNIMSFNLRLNRIGLTKTKSRQKPGRN